MDYPKYSRLISIILIAGGVALLLELRHVNIPDSAFVPAQQPKNATHLPEAGHRVISIEVKAGSSIGSEYDERVEKLAKEKYPETGGLQQIWGVGEITTVSYVLTIEDKGRFEKSRDVGPYLGLRPRRSQSSESDPELRITKAGDCFLPSLLVECAQRILSKRAPDTALKQFGLRIEARGKKKAKKRAIVAVARKLAVLLHKLWVTGEVYEPFPRATERKAA